MTVCETTNRRLVTRLFDRGAPLLPVEMVTSSRNARQRRPLLLTMAPGLGVLSWDDLPSNYGKWARARFAQSQAIAGSSSAGSGRDQ